jgi:hypothetical protein
MHWSADLAFGGASPYRSVDSDTLRQGAARHHWNSCTVRHLARNVPVIFTFYAARDAGMSWDVSVQRFSREYDSVEEIPEWERCLPIGSQAAVRAPISQFFPGADGSEPSWGTFESAIGSIEFNLGKDEPDTGFMVHVRASGWTSIAGRRSPASSSVEPGNPPGGWRPFALSATSGEALRDAA